jgi:hypothetical protein
MQRGGYPQDVVCDQTKHSEVTTWMVRSVVLGGWR